MAPSKKQPASKPATTKPTSKKKTGRPPYAPTERERGQVEALKAIGYPDKLIAKKLGINPRTLTKHFADVLEGAEEQATLNVIQSLYQKAVGNAKLGIKPELGAICYWLRNKAGWIDIQRHEHTGKGGGPIAVETSTADDGPDYDNMPLETLLELEALETQREQIIARSAHGNRGTETPDT